MRRAPNIRSKRAVAAVWPLVVLAGVVGLGCDIGCGDSETPDEPLGVDGLVEVVPDEAEVVVVGEEFDDLLARFERVVETLPVSSKGPGSRQNWRRVGAVLDEPAAAFWHDGQWVVVAARANSEESEIENWEVDGRRQEVDTGLGGPTAWRQLDPNGEWRKWASSDGRRVAAGFRTGEDADSFETRIWEERKEDRRSDPREVFPESENTDHVVGGAIAGEVLLEQFDGDGRAGQLLGRLVDQVGTVYWGLRSDEESEHRTVDLYTPGRPGTPRPIEDLGRARDELPNLGGLIQPGAPGVVRLSADPEQFVELMRSTLDAEQRQRLDGTLAMLRSELQLDLETDVVDNVTGHVAVVILGIEDAFFDVESGIDLVASTTRLETTRSAVIVPFDDRDAIESVLDVFTQISRGGLRRDAGEHTVQYAWFDDGVLEWAILVADEHLAFVDSMVALDHVRRWERSPGSLGELFIERGVDSMLDSRRGIGAYFDVATVRTVLDEGGQQELAAWLEPLEALRVQTDVDGRTDRAVVDVWLRNRVVGEGEE